MSEFDVFQMNRKLKQLLKSFELIYKNIILFVIKNFYNTWDSFDEDTRNIFIENLERSCTAEFSGFLLYKEISFNLRKTNPLLAEGFSFMSRDEARHAGFSNKAMKINFKISLDLGFLTKTVKYTF